MARHFALSFRPANQRNREFRKFDWYYIEIQRKEGTSLNKIARALGRAQSSVSREVHRNTGLRGYRHKQAQLKMQERHQEKPKMVKLTSEIKRQI